MILVTVDGWLTEQYLNSMLHIPTTQYDNIDLNPAIEEDTSWERETLEELIDQFVEIRNNSDVIESILSRSTELGKEDVLKICSIVLEFTAIDEDAGDIEFLCEILEILSKILCENDELHYEIVHTGILPCVVSLLPANGIYDPSLLIQVFTFFINHLCYTDSFDAYRQVETVLQLGLDTVLQNSLNRDLLLKSWNLFYTMLTKTDSTFRSICMRECLEQAFREWDSMLRPFECRDSAAEWMFKCFQQLVDSEAWDDQEADERVYLTKLIICVTFENPKEVYISLNADQSLAWLHAICAMLYSLQRSNDIRSLPEHCLQGRFIDAMYEAAIECALRREDECIALVANIVCILFIEFEVEPLYIVPFMLSSQQYYFFELITDACCSQWIQSIDDLCFKGFMIAAHYILKCNRILLENDPSGSVYHISHSPRRLVSMLKWIVNSRPQLYAPIHV